MSIETARRGVRHEGGQRQEESGDSGLCDAA